MKSIITTTTTISIFILSLFKPGEIKGGKVLFYSFNAVPSRKIRIGGSRLLQIKGTRSFRVKKGGSLSSIRRAGSLKSTKLSRQDSESENEELQLSHSRDTVTDIGNIDEPGLKKREREDEAAS